MGKTLQNQYLTLLLLGEEISLTKKQYEFARHYAMTGELTNSFLKAGYADTKGKKETASKLLRQPKIQKVIQHFQQRISQKLDISENRILAELAACGFSNLADLWDEDGRMVHPKHAPQHVQRAISDIKVKRQVEGPKEDPQEVEIMHIKMHPKLPALEKIAELKGMTAPKDPQAQRDVKVEINFNNNDSNVKVNSEG